MKPVLSFILAVLFFTVVQTSYAAEVNPSCSRESQCDVLKTYGPGVWPLKNCQQENSNSEGSISYLYVFKNYFLLLKQKDNHYTAIILDKSTCEELRRGEIISGD